MPYDDSEYEIRFLAAQAVTSTGDKGTYHTGTVPHMVRRIACIVTTATTASDPTTVSYDKRVLVGSDTGRVTGGIGTIIIPGGTAAGTVVYKDVSVLLNPGDEIVMNVSDASTAGAVTTCMLVEMQGLTPATLTKMLASA